MENFVVLEWIQEFHSTRISGLDRLDNCIVHQGEEMATADRARESNAKKDAIPIEEIGLQPQDEPHMFCSLLILY